MVTEGPSVGAATSVAIGAAQLPTLKGFPKASHHTPLQRYGSHTKYSCLQSSCPVAAVTQKFPQKTLSSSTCLGYGATAGWCLHHLPCFKPHSAGKLKCGDQSYGEFHSPSPESPGQAVNVSQRHSAKASPAPPPSPPDE